MMATNYSYTGAYTRSKSVLINLPNPFGELLYPIGSKKELKGHQLHEKIAKSKKLDDLFEGTINEVMKDLPMPILDILNSIEIPTERFTREEVIAKWNKLMEQKIKEVMEKMIIIIKSPKDKLGAYDWFGSLPSNIEEIIEHIVNIRTLMNLINDDSAKKDKKRNKFIHQGITNFYQSINKIIELATNYWEENSNNLLMYLFDLPMVSSVSMEFSDALYLDNVYLNLLREKSKGMKKEKVAFRRRGPKSAEKELKKIISESKSMVEEIDDLHRKTIHYRQAILLFLDVWTAKTKDEIFEDHPFREELVDQESLERNLEELAKNTEKFREKLFEEGAFEIDEEEANEDYSRLFNNVNYIMNQE